MKKVLILVGVGFVGICGWMILGSLNQMSAQESGRQPLTLLQQTTTTPSAEGSVTQPVPAPAMEPAPSITRLNAKGGKTQSVLLGSSDEGSVFKYQLDLTSTGAAIKTATFSEWDNRARKDPQQLLLLKPAPVSQDQNVLSLASRALLLYNYDQKLSLDQLDWELTQSSTEPNSPQTAQFEATITTADNQTALLVRKTYSVQPDTYLFDVKIDILNQTSDTQKVAMSFTGPVGLAQEGFRQDMRNTVALYKKADGEFSRVAPKSLYKADAEARKLAPENTEASLVWVAAINKYFAAIVVPQSDPETQNTRWLGGHAGLYFNPDGVKKPNGDETIGLNLTTTMVSLAPNAEKTYNMQVYLGPKDKNLFDKDKTYTDLGFVHTISFMGCCCPQSVIYPMAFGILWLMKAMFSVIGNYGIVIILLVLIMRLILHPVTKKSQISMHKMSKLAPRAEEIKKKYSNNKAEMNRQMMMLYKEQGASPIMGFLPMMIQMPVWISLWSAINASVDLRGEGLLPFWITDLSVPDQLFPFGFNVPFIGEYFNLLPLLMGVAFYLQQKLMPSQANAAANPQMAQQQKMMAIMMPIMFPIMLYKVPSGVNLYIMTSTALGVLEQHLVRKHIKEREAVENKGLVAVTSKTGGKVKKKKPKPMFKQFK